MIVSKKFARNLVFFSLLVSFVVLPVNAAAFPPPAGVGVYNICMEAEPQLGATHVAARPMGFGPAAGTPGALLLWRILTYEPFEPLNLWVCAMLNFSLPVVLNELYCWDENGGIHPVSTEGLVPFRRNTTVVDDLVLQLGGFSPGEGQQVDFYLGMTPASEELLELKNVSIWHAEWTQNSNALGTCYSSTDCTGRRMVSEQVKKCDCETIGGGSWQASGPPVGPCVAL